MFSGIIKKLFCQEDNSDLLAELQEKIGYSFKNIELLEQAVTHKSFANEMRHENSFGNERLEFLGDAVLELVISHILMDSCQRCSEGDLSRMRAAVVNTDALSSLALQLGFDEHILLSRGEDLLCLKASIPHLTRSSLHRRFQRHDISQLPEFERTKPPKRSSSNAVE